MKESSIDIIITRKEDFYKLREYFNIEVFKFFPNIKNPGFHNSIVSLYQIVEDKIIKGILFTTKSEFIELGSLEMSIIIFPKYQRSGIGKKAIKIISAIEKDYYFKIRNDNVKGVNFFNLHVNDNHIKVFFN